LDPEASPDVNEPKPEGMPPRERCRLFQGPINVVAEGIRVDDVARPERVQAKQVKVGRADGGPCRGVEVVPIQLLGQFPAALVGEDDQ